MKASHQFYRVYGPLPMNGMLQLFRLSPRTPGEYGMFSLRCISENLRAEAMPKVLCRRIDGGRKSNEWNATDAEHYQFERIRLSILKIAEDGRLWMFERLNLAMADNDHRFKG